MSFVVRTAAAFGLLFLYLGVLIAATDGDLKAAIIGTWRAASLNEGGGADRAEITYRNDGTFDFVIYSDSSCKNVDHHASGNWTIVNDELHTRTDMSAGSNRRLVSGVVTRDKIVSIADGSMELIDTRGNATLRVRGGVCRR